MDSVRRIAPLLMVWIAVLSATSVAALSDPDDFCTGDPCTISSPKTADSGIILDFGARDVILLDTLTIGDLPSGLVGTLTIKADNFSILNDGQIKGNGGSNPAGAITIETTGFIRVDGTRATGAFRLPGQDAGSAILVAGGDVFGAGRFNLERDGLPASGGELIIQAGGLVNLSGRIDAPGGVQGIGGTIDISAVGDIDISNIIDISGGESGGGSLDLFSQGSITLGEIDMSAGGDSGDAGLGDILALGDLTFTGAVSGSGADNGENCGDAADFDVSADGDITILEDFTMRGRGRDCSGGFFTIDGTGVTIAAEIDLSATGTEGLGGDLDIASVTDLLITGNLRVDGPDGAGDILISSEADMTIDGDLQADGFGTFGSGASLVEIDAANTLTVNGSIDASGGGQGSGGDISLDGCTVVQGGLSTLDARAAGGLISVIASDNVSLNGSFLGEITSPNAIEIRYGTKAAPPDIANATFNVPPTLVLSPLLVSCTLCDSDAECDDGNVCTTNTCIPALGCQLDANINPCDDGNACTMNDRCAFSLCIISDPVVCDDGNGCTDDSCDPQAGCEATPNTDPCDDGDACTENDGCSAGICGGSPIDCEDGNECTDNSCVGGACQSVDNTAPCEDGDACTTADTCSGGSCLGGAPPDCTDMDPCTTDSCDSGTGCLNEQIIGCFDRDGDGIIDDEDNCTTLDWTATPQAPPNQQPSKLGLILKNLSKPAGEQSALMKGFFNVAAPAMQIAPETNGIHFVLEDSVGVFYEINIPPGLVGDAQSCDPRDGWSANTTSSKPRWKYRNKSNALPPACTPGSARGISTIQVKDSTSTSKNAVQVKLKMKNGDLDRSPVVPLTKIQADFVLGAQASPGMASAEAINGQCAEAVIAGAPINIKSPKPFCKQKFRDAVIDKITCKGE